ncbi:MAG: FadR family transcriptional regulator [Methylocystaceae bacterium]|nr:FadR family transcriptional regulator [Methylocystaceae bacterium]
MFEKLAVQPAYHQVVEAIENKILSGELSLGDTLGTESELEQQFGVSRSSIREGLRVLEHLGMLTRDKGRRLSVGQPKSNIINSQIGRSLLMQKVTYRDLVEFLSFVEMASIESALKINSDDLLKELRTNLAQTQKNMNRPKKLARLDVEFHTTLAHATQNGAMIMAYEPVGQLIYASTQQVFESSPIAAQRLYDAHAVLVDALERKDRDTALSWMKKHILDFEKGLLATGVNFDEPVNPKYWTPTQ